MSEAWEDLGDRSLEEAEAACVRKIAEALDLRENIDVTAGVAKPGRSETAIFDIGHLHIGDQAAFAASQFCFRSTLSLCHRTRMGIQRWISRLMLAFPNSRFHGRASDLECESNVISLRIASESGGIGDVQPATLQSGAEVWAADIFFDTVFTATQTKE